MKKLIISIIFVLTIVAAHAQISGKSIPELRREASAVLPVTFYYSHLTLFTSSEFKPLPFYVKPTVPVIYSYHNLAFFCKMEVKLEKAVKMPIKFRLGDVDYVDRLEGKRE
jgi:hypothetical protein